MPQTYEQTVNVLQYVLDCIPHCGCTAKQFYH